MRHLLTRRDTRAVAVAVAVAVASLVLGGCATPRPSEPVDVDGPEKILSQCARQCDHILKAELARLSIIAGTKIAATGNWPRLKSLLTNNASVRPDALYWYALPDGNYCTSEHDRVSANLRTRLYFNSLLRGKPVIGEMTVGRTSGKKSIIVAVPISKAGKVSGMVGTSFYVDAFRRDLEKQTALPDTYDFFPLSPKGKVVFDLRDADATFGDILRGSDPTLVKAMETVLTSYSGTVNYLRGENKREAVFQNSSITTWKYVLSFPPRPKPAPEEPEPLPGDEPES